MTAPTDPVDLALVAALRGGLPLVERPYAALGEPLGLSEDEVITRLQALCDQDIIRRFGLIIHHHAVGWTTNAMVVLDLPDDQVSRYGRALGRERAVRLCYRRERCLPDWPYNLYMMIHGKDRTLVYTQIADILTRHGLQNTPRAVLFSSRQFKQTGGHYGQSAS